jgi:hypothetical protein
VRPQEKNDDEGTFWMTNEVIDVGTKVVGDKSSTQANTPTSSHPIFEEVHQPQELPTIVEDEPEVVVSEVPLDQEDDNEGQIQRQHQCLILGFTIPSKEIIQWTTFLAASKEG